MIVTRKYLPRRTFLRGVGTAVALPWLDAMVPAFAAPADRKTPVRLIFGYVPNGMMMKDWTPTGAGKNFEITRILKPLEPFREDMLVLTGLNVWYFHAKVYPGVAEWDDAAVAPWRAKMVGVVSMFLWFGIIIAGRWTAYL